MSAPSWEHPIFSYNELGEPLSSEAGALEAMGWSGPSRTSRRWPKSGCACLLCGEHDSEAAKAFVGTRAYICNACAEYAQSA